jgi:hypothetical protein
MNGDRSCAGAGAGIVVMLVAGASFYGGLLINPWLFAGYILIAVAILALGVSGWIARKRR